MLLLEQNVSKINMRTIILLLLFNCEPLVIVPGNVQQLNCVESTTSDNSIFIRWKEPAAVLDNEVISYRVVIKQLRHRDGTRQVVESPVQDFIINDLQVHITEGLGMFLYTIIMSMYALIKLSMTKRIN